MPLLESWQQPLIRQMMTAPLPVLPPLDAEWLAADGLGGFASGTVSGIRTRRYHALLLAATQPPAGRMTLVNGLEAWIIAPSGTHALTSQRYSPDVIYPDGATHLVAFTAQPWPRWTFRFEDGCEVVQELIVPHGSAAACLRWTLVSSPSPHIRLVVRPLLSGRDFHGTHHENEAFKFDPHIEDRREVWHPYEGVPGIVIKSNGHYAHNPCWYRNFLYTEEQARRLDCLEDLASPGEYSFMLADRPAELSFAMSGHETVLNDGFATIQKAEEQRLAAFPSPLHQAARSYVVRRGHGHTIIAGYPWFGDWGRDTFIALRGLCLATGQIETARDILIEWAGIVSEGMLPNRFPDQGDTPAFNAVDASLWYIVAVYDYLNCEAADPAAASKLIAAVEAILQGYSRGTRFGIHMDADGLIACGEAGVQLTWMDAKVGDWVVTPRMGKPVEVQALWINALFIGSAFNPCWETVAEKAKASFEQRFWNEAAGMLYDVVDVDGKAGQVDASLRPNQIFAIGGLPFALISGERARRMLETVEQHLLTPMGLRTLAPGSQDYVSRYAGDVCHRDAGYHQGIVWPWLMGPFVEAWLRVHGDAEANRQEVLQRFLAPLHAHLHVAGLGHISEVTDAEPPYKPNGCPFQAWSLGELLRIEHLLAAQP